MRILHVITDTNIGGAGRYLLNLVTQPVFKDHEILFACPDGELSVRIDALGIKRIPISGKDVSFSIPLIFELAKVIKSVKPDVVHTHSSLSGRIAGKFMGVPVVYTKHNLLRIPGPSGVMPPRAGTLKRLFNKVTSKALSNKIIAVSQGVYDDLVEAGYPADLVVSIPNGIDLAPFKPNLRVRGDDKKITVGTVARLHPQKALHVLLDAARIVVNSYPSVRFVIGGTGPSREVLETRIKELKLETYVKMEGFIEDVPGFLQGLDIYALSSNYEGLPLAVLEAMAAGLPVVATAVGGVPEAVVNGLTGILVPPGDPKLFAQAIVRLIVDREMAFKMGEAGRKRVEELFSAEKMAEKTFHVYEEVVRR